MKSERSIILAGNSNLDNICDQLRTRICSGVLKGGDIMVEDALAKEFSLSRTPIRQVLHRLAHEHFVETKTGVGTIVVPEDRWDFTNDLRAYRDILKISATRKGDQLSSQDEFELIGLSAVVARIQETSSADMIWEYFYRTGQLICRNIEHDLISETAFLLNCRVFRQLISSFDGNLQWVTTQIATEYEALRMAKIGTEILNTRISSIISVKNSYKQEIS